MDDAGTRFWSGTHGLNEEVYIGTGEGWVTKSVCCLKVNVRVFVMYCGNVQDYSSIRS